MNKHLVLPVVILIIAIIAVAFFIQRGMSEEESSALQGYIEVVAYQNDTMLNEPLVIKEGEAMVLENGAKLLVRNDVTIEGALGCRNGSLHLEVEGNLTIRDSIICEGSEAGEGGVVIIARGGLHMSPDTKIVADGNVQLVDTAAAVRSGDELNRLYDEVETIPESGQIVGPFVDDSVSLRESSEKFVSSSNYKIWNTLINTAHAQVNVGTTTVSFTAEPITVSGKIKVETPKWKGARRIVVFDFPNTPSVTIQDFELTGPDGRPGDPDKGSCDVTGKDGEDAFRFNAFAPNLTVNNFTLTLGSGGEGGDAETGSDCETATAKGGKGGKPGNFRMIGSQKFQITGAFNIHPGNGGGGGVASAKGKDGEAGEKGGNADATGGNGADNKKRLSVAGTVGGTNNVQFGDAVGGMGGPGYAEGGKGGDGDTCGMNGGPGGKATGRGGKGGDAKLSVSGGAGRMAFANDIGGAGGLTEATGGKGGNGGSCGSEAKGGDGGDGGDASATEGKGGQGKSGPASDGAVLDETGGDGGDGGDGCTEGKGGKGGSGDPDGEDGEDGTNLCITVTKEEDYISLVPGEIQVIQYMDYYIPITNLEKFTDEQGLECDGEEHWHPGLNGAINTEGMVVPDPDPNNCGFGKVSEVPVLIIEDPNIETSSEGAHEIRVEGLEGLRNGGEMIEVDPPTLVIPAGTSG